MLFRTGAVCLLAAALAWPAMAAEPAAVTPPRMVKIILIGDSTVAVQGGWGPSFCGSHVTSAVACINMAKGGRSTGNYRAEGSWDIAVPEMRPNGFAKSYVLIQFGHNDQPGKPGRSTDLATEYPANLRRYIADVQAQGAIPVLVTPLTRRQFKDGQLLDDLGPWADAMRAVAKETGVFLLDLHARSRQAVQEMGPVKANGLAQLPPPAEVQAAAASGTTIAAPKPGEPAGAAPAQQNNAAVEPMGQAKLSFDYTHLGRDGADLFATIITDEMARTIPDLRRFLIP